MKNSNMLRHSPPGIYTCQSKDCRSYLVEWNGSQYRFLGKWVHNEWNDLDPDPNEEQPYYSNFLPFSDVDLLRPDFQQKQYPLTYNEVVARDADREKEIRLQEGRCLECGMPKGDHFEWCPLPAKQ